MAQELADKIRAAAQAKNIDPDIALAIARAESSLRPEAKAGTSSAGGLFQVVDKTWREFGGNPKKKLDADENIRVGTDIIAKNTQTLKSFLNRDPRPAEVYAAHYFGPSGAKNFLSADPATPIVDILGKSAVKANPNLQGKNVGQVMAQLEKKMGSGPAPTANVSRETPAPREALPPSLPPMAAAPAATPAPSKMANLGPSYQAALALSFLADTDEKEDRDIDREPGVAEKWLAEQAPRPAALAEFANVSIKSPFAAMEPQQPQMLADGGEVGEQSAPDVGRPTVSETQLAKVMFPELPVAEAVYLIRGGQRQSTPQGEMLMGNLGAQVPLGKDSSAMLMLAGSRPEREMTESKALMAAFNKRVGDEGGLNLNVVRPLDAPGGVLAGGLSASYPMGEGRISGNVNALRLPGQDPRITGYGVGYGGRVGPGNLSAQIMKQKDGPYSGQVEYRLPIGRADGGEVERLQGEARELDSYQALEKYLQSRDEMPGVKITTRMPEGTDGLYTSDNLNIGSGTIKINKNTPKAALASLLTHEMTHAADRQMKQQAIEQGMFGKSNQYTEAYEKLVGPEGRNRTALARRLKPEWAAENRLYRADPKEIAAHGVGAFAGPTLQDRGPRHVDATAATEFRILMDLAQRNVDKGPTGLEKIPAFFRKMGRYSDGGDVTAEEIEAASRPATVNPNIQRQGEAARRLAAMRDVNTLPDPRTFAAVSGFLGTAPDQQGFSAMHPDAEGIKKAGQAGFGVGTALQVAPVAAAVRGAAGKGTTTAAKMMEGMKDVPVGMSIKPVQSIFSPIPSADAPFVGRLDEFVSGLPGPVQKDQFLGMLKGKMRDYDIARAEATLADLPGNAKLNPVDLLNRIKTQYDPSQFKTTIIPPGKPGEFYQSMDNPYIGSTKDGQPLGVIHLSQGMLPDAVAQQERIKEAGLALSRIGTSGPVTAADPTIADDLLNFLQSPGVPLSDATAAKMAEVAQGFRKVAEFDQAWDAAKSNIMYPALNADFWPTVNNYAKQLSETQGKGFYDPDVQSLATGMAVRDYSQKGNQWLVANGAAPIDLPDFTAMKDAALHVSGNPELLKAIRTGFDDARAANREVLKEVKKEATEARRMFGDDTRDLAKYEGQHPSLKNPPSPIAFSRFSEHTTEIPGIGKADGIYVNELQSDLLDDLRKRGPKGGSRQKDEEEFRRVLSDINAVADPRSAEAMGLHGRRRILDQRRASPESQYALPEAFAGMETSPQVVQQLMVKNAVSGAMQMGKQFVAFPGAESAQAQLYEKLGPNLKSVVKDLGPGFELRDVTLRDPDGKQLMHKAIVWGPDAAARVQKKGVPFKDGGAVERQTADHRKYL